MNVENATVTGWGVRSEVTHCLVALLCRETNIPDFMPYEMMLNYVYRSKGLLYILI